MRTILPSPTAKAASGEQNLERLISQLPIAAYICDRDGVIKSYNNPAVDLWGRAPPVGSTVERFCGSHQLCYPNGKIMPHERSPMAVGLRTRRAVLDQDVIIVRPDGSRRCAIANIVPLYDSAGRWDGAINCVLDVTARQHAILAQEEERRRVARELHDAVGQVLSSARLRLKRLLAEAGPKSRGAEVGDVLHLLDRALRELGAIAQDLRPQELDALGLESALRGLAADFMRRSRLRVWASVSSIRPALANGAALTMYRIAQEALANVERHAQATRVALSLGRHGGRVVLRVKDDGRGCPVARLEAEKPRSRGMGLRNMRERAQSCGGTLDMRSAPGAGTEIVCRLPAAAGGRHGR